MDKIISIDHSISKTAVVILQKNKIIFSKLLKKPKNFLELADALNIPIKETPPFKLKLIDKNRKILKKVKDRTKEEKDSFKIPQEMLMYYYKQEFSKICDIYKPNLAVFEEIAFGATGQVITLGKLLGFLQNEVMQKKIPFTSVNIMHIKKFATGKGNALKNTMIAAIPKEVQKDLFKDEKVLDDLADAYHLAKYVQKYKKDLKWIKT